MRRAALIGTLVVSLVTGSAALADGRGHGHDSDRGGRDNDRERSWSHHGERHESERRDYDRRDYDRHDYDRHDYYSHRWSRGERLPVAYYGRPYVINDYYDYGLYAPPRGHHWVRVDGDAVLAAVATGIVLDTVFHHFH
jgi:Ni/Co efflux regulator RcnB